MQGSHQEQYQKEDAYLTGMSSSYFSSDGHNGHWTIELEKETENGDGTQPATGLQRNRQLLLINQWGQEMAATLDPEEVIDQLLQKVTEIINAEGASLWLREDKDPDGLICRAAIDTDTEAPLVQSRVPSGQSIVGQAVESGESIITHNVVDNQFFFAAIDRQIGFRTRSLMAVPLRVRGRVIGALEIVNKQDGYFDQDDLMLVETLAASAAIALDNARMVKALQEHAAELEARNEELDAFAHTAAHDLKAPLSLIVGFADLVHRYHDTMPDQELAIHLHTIVQSGRKMSNIIDELLLLAGVRQNQKVELETLDMTAVVAEVQKRLLHLIEERQAQIVTRDKWPAVLGYAPWVEEIWMNYISNAIKYGGEPPLVELGCEPMESGNMCRFWVRDNGEGLTPEEQERLFKPFSRLRTRAKGHGLGLSIVQRIVNRFGGEVAIQSQVGQGSEFSFTLPAVTD